MRKQETWTVKAIPAMTEQMQDELDQKDQTILELNRQLNRSLTLNEKLNERKQSREYRSIADKIKANRGTINQRDRQQERADAEGSWHGNLSTKKRSRQNAMHRHTKRR